MQNLLETLKELLAKDDRLTAEGELLKNKVVELALKLDENLITLLLSHNKISEHFFARIGEATIFDKDKFVKFVSNKQFLPDSYTAFKNKIGLTEGDGFISEKKDVVLSWPYKDCVLEGGQTKEDAKRNEVFWNQTLAPDEIDRLLDPKVFTRAKRIDKDGEHNFDTFNRRDEGTISDNLVIKGNNLLALHSLKKQFAGKVKLIYIDPPYNKASDTFYNDKFKHSTWLTFIKNRLEVARGLLHKEGIIFIHIGDEELHYLKTLADDVFKRENFIATIPRKTRSGKSDTPWKLSQDFDWMLIYTKSTEKETQLFKRAIDRRYYSSPDYPGDEWRLSDLTTQRTIKERPNSDFTLVNPKTGDKYPVNSNRSWAVTIDTVDDYIEKGKIVFPGDYKFLNITVPAMRIFKSEEIAKYGEDFDKTYISSDFLNKAIDDLLGTSTYNKVGTDEMVSLFGNKRFDYPKPELLLHRIIEYSTDEGDIVMDFFAGSGTTGAVAHKMNRQYLLVEQIDGQAEIIQERLKKVMNGEQGGISEEVNWQGGGDYVYLELKKWNQKFVEKVRDAKNRKELKTIWEAMQGRAFLSWRLDIKKFEKNAKEFEALSLENQKKFLIEILDQNQLYVNYSEIDDEMYGVSDEDKKLNKKFYKK